MEFELFAILFVLIMAITLLVWLFQGRFRPDPVPASAQAVPTTASAGLIKAAKVFFVIGLVLGVGCFLLNPMIGAFAASGPFTLAIVLWIIGACMK